jgi:hypothetical protein
MLARVDRVEGPATVDDCCRLFCVVSGAGNELQPVNDGCRLDRSPQRTLVFVQVTQDGGEKVGVVEVGDVSCVAATGRPDESWPGGDDEDRMVSTGLNCPLLLSVDMVQSPLRCNHQLADDMKSVVAFDASANDSNVAVVVQGHETGIVQAKEDDRSIGGDSTETLLQIRDQFVHTVLGYLPPALCVFLTSPLPPLCVLYCALLACGRNSFFSNSLFVPNFTKKVVVF